MDEVFYIAMALGIFFGWSAWYVFKYEVPKGTKDKTSTNYSVANSELF